jgi:hypothetical protein
MKTNVRIRIVAEDENGKIIIGTETVLNLSRIIMLRDPKIFVESVWHKFFETIVLMGLLE